MIKFFKNQDIIITPFTIAKPQTVNSVLNDLIAANDGDDIFPLTADTTQCNDNVSGSCSPSEDVSGYLAISQFENVIDFEIGKYVPSSSVFYPSGSAGWSQESNPMNLDGTYQRQVYNTVFNMYYNNYNNAYNIFGFDEYDTSKASLHLTNEFSLLQLSISQTGDKIRPNTVVISNQSGDVVADIVDDGNYNLKLSGSYFVNKYPLVANSDDLTYPVNICGLGAYLSNPTYEAPCCDIPPAPTPTPTPTPTPSVTITPSVTLTPTRTITPTPTPSVSSTPASSVSPTPTVTPSITKTPSTTATPSVSATPSSTPDASVSATPSVTPSETVTPSVTQTPLATPSNSPAPSPSNSPAASPSNSPAPSPSNSPIPDPSPTPTPSSSPPIPGVVYFVVYPAPSSPPNKTACPDPKPGGCDCYTTVPTPAQKCNSTVTVNASCAGDSNTSGVFVYTACNNTSFTSPTGDEITAKKLRCAGNKIASGYFTDSFSPTDSNTYTVTATHLQTEPVDGCCTPNVAHTYNLSFGNLLAQIYPTGDYSPVCGSGTLTDPYRVWMSSGEVSPCAPCGGDLSSTVGGTVDTLISNL